MKISVPAVTPAIRMTSTTKGPTKTETGVHGVILAHSQDGQRLSIKRWGPLWTIYPRDQYPAALRGPIAESRFIWQIDRIEARG